MKGRVKGGESLGHFLPSSFPCFLPSSFPLLLPASTTLIKNSPISRRRDGASDTEMMDGNDVETLFFACGVKKTNGQNFFLFLN